MDQRSAQTFFALLRSGICGTQLTQSQIASCTEAELAKWMAMAQKHDVAHLLALGLKQNRLTSQKETWIEKSILQAVYRYECLRCELSSLCDALEAAQIPFVPLKGSVLRRFYPEAWMRTSCDIDILVSYADLEKAIACLKKDLNYIEKERATHDVSLFSPTGQHVELHFDLVEEGRAKDAAGVLRSLWDHVSLGENSAYQYEMSDAFFYFYHIAHMAKHFESGGCGIRPFIDLWILDHMEGADQNRRNALLAEGGLLQFANASRKLSSVWFGGEEADALSLQMQVFVLSGGGYGSFSNRVALQQKEKGGKMGYLSARIFAPYEKLKRYYPVLEKHRWLMPVMQVRRWAMLLDPKVARMAREEMKTNRGIDKRKAEEMNLFLREIGL